MRQKLRQKSQISSKIALALSVRKLEKLHLSLNISACAINSCEAAAASSAAAEEFVATQAISELLAFMPGIDSICSTAASDISEMPIATCMPKGFCFSFHFIIVLLADLSRAILQTVTKCCGRLLDVVAKGKLGFLQKFPFRSIE